MNHDVNVRLPKDLKLLLVQQFSADELLHLATFKRLGSPELQARQRLSPESRERLTEMLLAGRLPSLGWWQRNLAASAEDEGGSESVTLASFEVGSA